MIGFVDQQQSGDDYEETVTSWTNPHTAEYKRREQILMNTRGYEVTALQRSAPRRRPVIAELVPQESAWPAVSTAR